MTYKVLLMGHKCRERVGYYGTMREAMKAGRDALEAFGHAGGSKIVSIDEYGDRETVARLPSAYSAWIGATA